ncbi:hypothetical protein GPECTOR_29g127 [Gonium pectorale]|uniref:Plastid lipid-associated protein/fibrillin conserved domain-containing protein n=1 Tax=Gonium pectorale TaxID=33097 RepID=A0A150GEG2_GONPE|nr:hypothetical protein GPECTOR_29g127 [Gonium pectorale]|eukprot:KXZ48222.1 hypothetical protein GPECTOR_29g127 [Gonium pectorale]
MAEVEVAEQSNERSNEPIVYDESLLIIVKGKVQQPKQPDHTESRLLIQKLQAEITKRGDRIKEIKTVEEQLRSNAKGASSGNREVLGKLKELRDQRGTIIRQKAAIRDELNNCDSTRESIRAEMRSIRDKNRNVNSEKVEQEIRDLEFKLQHESLGEQDEKRAQAQLQALTAARPIAKKYSEFDARLKELDAQRTGIIARLKESDGVIAQLDQQIAAASAVLDEAKAKTDAQFSDLPTLQVEKKENYEIMVTLRAKIDELRKANDAEYQEFIKRDRAYRGWKREQSRKKYEERQKEREERDRQRQEENKLILGEVVVEPYSNEIFTCDQLLTYLRSFTAVKEEVKEEVKQVEAPAGLKPFKRQEVVDEMFTGVPKQKPQGKGKAAAAAAPVKAAEPAKPKVQKLNHMLDMLKVFLQLQVEPPTTTSGIPATIEKVEARKEEYKLKQEEAKRAPPPAANGRNAAKAEPKEEEPEEAEAPAEEADAPAEEAEAPAEEAEPSAAPEEQEEPASASSAQAEEPASTSAAEAEEPAAKEEEPAAPAPAADEEEAGGEAEAASSGTGLDVKLKVEEGGRAAVVRAVSGTQRGKAATPEQRAAILPLLEALEARNAVLEPVHSGLVSGVWALLYQAPLDESRAKVDRSGTTEGPFLAAFQPLTRDFVRTKANLQLLDLEGGRAENLAEFSIAGRWDGALNIVGSAMPQPTPQGTPSTTRVDVTFNRFELRIGSAIKLRVPLDWVRPKGWIETTYIDEELRIGRGDKGSIFVASRPAKQSRREGKTRPIDRDVYEAEDSDPDEVKHAERFDQVDNYEYELPSDFEDEEIDEETAFTEEDKKKFGAWFEKEIDADDDDGAGVGDDDGEDWGDDDDEGEDAEDEEDKDPGSRGAAARLDSGDGDDDLFLGDDDDDDEEDDEQEEDEEGEEDAERHGAMLRDVLGAVGAGGDGSRKRARRDPNAAVVSEAYPESQYNLNPGAASAGGDAGSLSVADLLRGLTGEERRKLGAARKLLEKVAGDKGGADGGNGKSGKSMRPVSVPLPTIVAERQERKAGYEAASEEVTRWQPIVKANREAPTLRLVAGRDEVPRINTTAALVAQHTPSADNALEAEVAALLNEAGAGSAEAIEEAEEALALKALSLEEARERRARLAKLRSLLFYHELKSRRLKAIKSKEYHRHLARAAKRKATKMAAAAAEAGPDGDVDGERAAAIEAEFQRAKERLTLRHRNSSRWARRALKRGQLDLDAGTKAAIADQLQLGQQLRRKIEGRKGSGSDEDGSDSDASTSASDGEGERGGGGLGRAVPGGKLRSAALDILKGNGPLDEAELPKKGLLALPFMKRALERRRLAAQQDAEELMRELDEQQHTAAAAEGDDDDAAAAGGRVGGGLAALVGYELPATSAPAAGGRRKFGASAAGEAAAAAAAAAEAAAAAREGSDLESDDAEDAEAKAERLGRPTPEAAAAAAAAARKEQQQAKKGKKGKAAAVQPSAADQADLDAALRAGAAGRGMLVTSADAGISLAVAGREGAAAGSGDVDADPDAERRESSRAAGTRGALADAEAHRVSLAAGGGRAALFAVGGSAGKSPTAAAEGGDAAPKFIPSKKFTGAKSGYAFKKGPQGLGYYIDPKSGGAAAGATATAVAAGAAKGKQPPGKGASATGGIAVAGQGKPTAPAAVAGQEQKKLKGKAAMHKGEQEQEPRADGAEAAAGAPAAAAGGDGPGSDGEDAPMMRPASLAQQDLIRQAFAGDDVEAEFAAEKAAAVTEELPEIQEPSSLPGWGAWAGQQRNPKWMQAAKDRAAKQRAEAAAGRKDANLKYVVISERWDKKAAKYTAPTAPFPFTSPEAYERSLRQPLGREYNPDASFRDLTRPAVLKQAGVVIEPLRFSESAAKDAGLRGKEAERKREAKRVLTVAGGMPRAGKAKAK